MSDPRDGEVVCQSPACLRFGIGTKLNREDKVCWRCGADAFLSKVLTADTQTWYVNTPDVVVTAPGGETLVEYKTTSNPNSRRPADCPHCGQAAPAGAFKGHRACLGCGQCVLCPFNNLIVMPQFMVPASFWGLGDGRH